MEKEFKLPSDLFEPSILAHCLKDLSFFLKIKPYLDTSTSKDKSYFHDRKIQKIFNYICKWYDKFYKFPTIHEMKALVTKAIKDKEELDILLATTHKVYEEDTEKFDIRYLEEEIKDFIKKTRVEEAVIRASLDIETGNTDSIVDLVTKAVQVNFDKDLGVSIKDIDQTLDMLMELKNENAITTGYSKLNEAMDGGVRNKEIIIFAATPGLGKTLFLGNFAINAFFDSKKVLVFTFETATRRLLARYFSNIINVKSKELILDEEAARQKLHDKLDDQEGDIIIKEYPANVTSTNDLMAYINDLKLYKSWSPDMIVVDYILIMGTNDKSLSSDQPYKYYKTITEELRNMAMILDVPILTATQINREGMDEKGGSKALTTAKDISESRGIYDTADFFATLNQPAKDRGTDIGEVMMYIDKNRNGEKGQRIKFEVDYVHQRVTEK